MQEQEIKALRTANLPGAAVLYVIRERDNKVIGRLEVYCIITHVGRGTPSRKELIEVMSSLYSKPPELVVVKYIRSDYGIGRSRVKVHIYESVERLKSFEPEYILKRLRVS
ncbi:MAG: 30S ribosomal protein S24e [Desulfurococcales archaeon]|nr:30S ribosomal protein S24e [Desulfurococcales archaeon]RLG76077.1 MAG: 30S ribosomal protein S24e [Thermoprotei archaeon]